MGLSLFTKLMTTSYGIKASGYNYENQLDGASQLGFEPNIVEPKVYNVNLMDKSAYHTIYVLNNGDIWVSGANDKGQLGLGNSTPISNLTKVSLTVPSGIKQVCCGGYCTYILANNGKLYGTGSSEYGQLGKNGGLNTSFRELTDITNRTGKVEKVWAGGYHSVFLSEDGFLYGVGKNHHYQLGTTSTSDIIILPYKMDGVGKNPRLVALGTDFSYFLTDKDKLMVCGYDGYGQLGKGTVRNTPTGLTSITNRVQSIIDEEILQIECGASHVLIRTNSDYVYGCGDNQYGQLGLGESIIESSSFVKLDVMGIRNIVTDAYSSIYQINTQYLKGSGHNRFGELGLGDTENRYTIVDLLYTDIYLDDLRDEVIIIPEFDRDTNLYVIDGYWVRKIGENIIYMDNEMNLVVRNQSDMSFRYIRYFYSDKGIIKFSHEYGDVFDVATDERYHLFEASHTVANVVDTEDGVLYFSIGMQLFGLNPDTGELNEIINMVDKVLKYEDTENMYISYIYNYTLYFSKDLYDVATPPNSVPAFTFKKGTFIEYPLTTKPSMGLPTAVYCHIDEDSDYECENFLSTDTKTGTLPKVGDKSYQVIKYEELYLGKSPKSEKAIYFIGDHWNNSTHLYSPKPNNTRLSAMPLELTNEIQKLNLNVSAMYYERGRLYLGTHNGYLYCAYIEEERPLKLHFLHRFASEIINITSYHYSNVLDKSLIIDEHGKYLIITCTDGRYIKYPVCKSPEITLEVDDSFQVDDSIYHNVSITLNPMDTHNTYDNYTYGMKFLLHNRYNDYTISSKDMDITTGKFHAMLKFDKRNIDVYNWLWCNYIYGNSCRGTVGVKTYNVKINLLYSYLNQINFNISNYTSNTCEVILEKINPDKTVTTLEKIQISNEDDHVYGRFSRYDDLQYFNIRVSSGASTTLLMENINVLSVTFDDTIGHYNNEFDIINNFGMLYNHIYEQGKLDEISEEYIFNILSILSKKSHEQVVRKNDISILPKGQIHDVNGNDITFLMNNETHYLHPLNPKKLYKDVRYRTNIYINGKKVPYNEVYNLIDMKNGAINTYFTDIARNDTTDNTSSNGAIVDFNLYNENLMDEERELYTIYVRKFKDFAKLLSGEYRFTVQENFSDYLDLDNISVYVKFRHGSFWNRIELADFQLEIDACTPYGTSFKIKIKNEVLCKVGNEIHIVLNDLDKRQNYIFKDTARDKANKYKNFFIPLLELTDKGNIINHYTQKSENVEVFVDGVMLTPYIDYKVVNFPLHLQFPTMLIFLHPVKNDLKIEVNIMKENYLDAVVTTKSPWSLVDNNAYTSSEVIDEKNKDGISFYSSLGSNYVPMLNSTCDLFIDGLKVPVENIKDTALRNEYMELHNGSHINYLKFYLEDKPFVKFLCTLLRLKLHNNSKIYNDKTKYDNLKNDVGESFSYKNLDKSVDVYEDDSKDGLLYLLFEEFDTQLGSNQDIEIDCGDNTQVKFHTNVRLDANLRFSLPYITEDLKANFNADYDIKNYDNEIHKRPTFL